jgi:hypothetical protein
MRTMRRIALLVLLVATPPPAAAHDGGWATVELYARPDAIAAG